MTAQIIFLAEYKERRMRIEWAGDPLVWMRAWFDFWAGVRK